MRSPGSRRPSGTPRRNCSKRSFAASVGGDRHTARQIAARRHIGRHRGARHTRGRGAVGDPGRHREVAPVRSQTTTTGATAMNDRDDILREIGDAMRVEPSLTFAARVRARVEAEPARRPTWAWAGWVTTAAAAVLVVGVAMFRSAEPGPAQAGVPLRGCGTDARPWPGGAVSARSRGAGGGRRRVSRREAAIDGKAGVASAHSSRRGTRRT